MRLQHQRGRTRSGFTLIELAIVLVLIAILSALIIPEMRGTLEGERLRAASRELIRGLSIAHSQSVTLNQAHRLVIDKSNNRYRVERLARSADEGSGYVPVRGVDGTEASISDKITIEVGPPAEERSEDGFAMEEPPRQTETAPDLAIDFLPDGTAEAAEIRLRDAAGFGLALNISPITARVQVRELEREASP